MDITWYGHSCFRINERNFGSVVCDPYDYEKIGYEPLKLKADIVTMSNDKPGHSFLPGIKTEPFVIDRPGEYEINNIFITGHQTTGKGEPRNTIFVIEINGLFVAHMGNINRPPTQTEVEELGTVNVLLVPVGGGAGLNAAQAVETIRMIQPNTPGSPWPDSWNRDEGAYDKFCGRPCYPRRHCGLGRPCFAGRRGC